MLKCCEPFNADIANEVFTNVSAKIKFCPFCGKSLGPRSEIEASNLHGYHVWLDGKSVAHFDTRKEAEEYVLLQ